MLKWLKLSKHHHSGHIRPHEHTSYSLLGLMLLITAFPLTAYTAYAESPGPEASSIGLTGTMPGKAPTVAATIDSPTDQKHTTTSPITISGTCPSNTLVEIFKSDIFAGSTTCNDDETYSVDIDLLINKNTLVAKVYDSLNQAGPDSNSIVIYYDALPTQAGPITTSNLSGAQLLLNTDAVYRGTFSGQELTMPIEIIGGSAPYALNVQWGDSTNKVVSRNDNISFTTGHIYNKPGTYKISLQATDAQGRVAFMTVAAIVNGQTSVASNTASISNTTVSKLLILWPLYVGAIAVVLSFWLGEIREKRILRSRGMLSSTPQIS